MSCVWFESSSVDQWSNKLQGEGKKKKSLLESIGCSSKMRLITAKPNGECFFFKNNCCEHDCLQNRSDINLFCF